MERLQPLTDPTSRISRNIGIRAARLARSGAVPGMEAEDIAQELRLDIIRRAPNYYPEKASFDTFADRIVANRIADLARPTTAMVAERAMESIDAPVSGDDGDMTLGDTLPETAALHPPAGTGSGLRHDVGRLLASLCPASRTVALALGSRSVAETARLLGIHRSTVYERIAAIRATATDLGLEAYFEADPTVAAPRR